VNATGFVFALALFSAAVAAAIGRGPRVSLRDFEPPLLLGGSPNFFLSTTDARERNVDVKAALNKIRCTVTVVGNEKHWVAIDGVERALANDVRSFDCTCQLFGFQFRSSLLVALHQALRWAE